MRRLVVLLGIGATLCLAGPAQATPDVDASFLDALTRAGIAFNSGPNAIAAGKTACELMGQGQPELDVVQRVTEQNPGLTTTTAAKFTAIAASAYCPQFLQRATGGESGKPPSP